MKHNTLVIGLGSVGMGYDYAACPTHSKVALSHSQAISIHPDFDLIAGVDRNPTLRSDFEKKFQVPCYISVTDALEHENIDIVVISTPTETHLEVFSSVLLSITPKIIILEKPVAYSAFESKEIVNLARSHEVAVAVNYFRAFEPTYARLRSKLAAGMLGFPLTAVAKYSGGMINNGSHWVEYLSAFLGDVGSVKLVDVTRYQKHDFNGVIKIDFDKGRALFLPFEDFDFFLFELEVVGPQGKLLIDGSNGTIHVSTLTDDPLIPNARVLGAYKQADNADVMNYQRYIYDEVSLFLRDAKPMSCSIEDLSGTLDIFSMFESQLEFINAK